MVFCYFAIEVSVYAINFQMMIYSIERGMLLLEDREIGVGRARLKSFINLAMNRACFRCDS